MLFDPLIIVAIVPDNPLLGQIAVLDAGTNKEARSAPGFFYVLIQKPTAGARNILFSPGP